MVIFRAYVFRRYQDSLVGEVLSCEILEFVSFHKMIDKIFNSGLVYDSVKTSAEKVEITDYD